MSDQLGDGLIGAGRIRWLRAGHLARRIANARPPAVADVSPEAARRCADGRIPVVLALAARRSCDERRPARVG